MIRLSILVSVYTLLQFTISISLGESTSTFIDATDREHLKNVLEPAWKLEDLPQVLYAAGGYKYLGLAVPNKDKLCAFVKQHIKEGAEISDLYFAASASKSVGCSITAPAYVKKIITDSLREGTSPQELFYAVGAAKNFGVELDNGKALRVVQQALKKDDSVLSLGYAFHIGSQLQGDVSSIFERIEDAIVQADEVDGNMLQFEGGLSITALVLSGAYRLAETSQNSIPIKEDQVVKFSNYLMSRKSVQMPKGVYYLLDAVSIFTNNKFHIPVSITLTSSVAISAESPKIKVRVTDLMGSDIGPLKVSAASATEVASGKSFLSNKAFASNKEKSVYELDIMALKPSRGFYKLSINVEGSNSKLVGNRGAALTFKVLSSISLLDVEVGTVDADQSVAPNLKKVTYPEKVKGILDADQHQKLLLRYVVKDVAAGQPSSTHQSFIKVTHQQTKREIIFNAESDSSGVFKFDLDVTNKRKEFGGMSGKYALELVIGDASISNPLVWNLVDVMFSFPDSVSQEEMQDLSYDVKSEIHHLFHSPDPRPPRIVSLAFTALCLSPLIILLIGWSMLGVNISNIPVSMTAIGFHIGLGGIFLLFGWFFLELNMFSTLRYLLMLGTVTFFCGNSMLSTIAGWRKE